jgi:hypothetical protein
MRRLRVLLCQLSSLFRKGRLEGDLDDEFHFHLEMETAENLRTGMAPEEVSNATLSATVAAELFATEKNLPGYGAFPPPLTAVPAATLMIWQNRLRTSPKLPSFAGSADLG